MRWGARLWATRCWKKARWSRLWTVSYTHLEEEKAATRYYKSVEIQEGDSLWSLAKEYREGGSLSAKEYVEELKKMNNLREDTIHTGQYLTVVYFAEE